MTESVTIVLLGTPVPWARTAGGRTVGLFTPAKQRRNAQTLAVLAQQEMLGRAPFDGPIELNMLAAFPVPASWSGKKRAAALRQEIFPAKRPDLSNLLKQVEDSLNGVVFRDDALIVQAQIAKIYGEEPQIVVTISTLS